MNAMTIEQALQSAIQHHQSGRLAEAESLCRQILSVQAGHTDALHLLGIIAHQAGQSGAAVEMLGRAIGIHPANPVLHCNLGRIFSDLDRLDEAIAAFQRALALRPDLAEAHYRLGGALGRKGLTGEAIESYRNAIRWRAAYPEAYSDLGVALFQSGRVDEAIAACRNAIGLQPGIAAIHHNLGLCLEKAGRNSEAAAAFRQALALNPEQPEAANCLGVVLRNAGRNEEAVACFRDAIRMRPVYAEAHNNLGGALLSEARQADALAAFRRAADLRPEHAGMRSNVIYALLFDPDAGRTTLAQEHREWNRRFAGGFAQASAPHANDRTPERRLRIGYVSADLRDHVIGRNVWPLFAHHDRAGFEILCYAHVARTDALTERFRQRADRWRDTAGMGDDALAAMIRNDAVDILVDLAQHTAGNRLPVFARRPAPVQASFAGYPESPGVEAIGHRITDRLLEGARGAADDPACPGEQLHFIDSFWCYDPCGLEADPGPLPALAAGRLTFGCLNNFCKTNRSVFRLWARVLAAVPGSSLIVLSPEGGHRQGARDLFAQHGIAADRIEFAAPRPRNDYLALHRRLDIVLDTFPYNGHSTSLDALWMGVPVITLAGTQPVSRAGLSQLSNLGLPELVADSEDAYVEIASALAGDLPRLAHLRSTLRGRMLGSVLTDAPRFARQIEAAYRQMWRAWCTTQRSTPPS